jgi:hypothetical protein
VLAGWWRQLAPLAPQSLSVAHLLLHRVEALVLNERATPLDPFAAFVLRAVALAPALAPAELESHLPVGRQFIVRILGELAAGGLVELGPAGRWRVTAAGRSVTPGAESRRTSHERRTFHFRDTPQAQFVPLEVPPGHEVTPPAHWSFDPAVLRRCVDQAPDWKRRHGFPADVRAVLGPDAPEVPGEPPAWQRVMVDRPEHVVLALAVVPGEELRGFVVESRGWLMSSARAALTMGAGWQETFPEVALGPSQEAWRGAWRTWCQGRGVTPPDAESCALNREGPLLRVDAPKDIIGRLHLDNGEVTRDEVWLLAGEGMMRTAARVELTP